MIAADTDGVVFTSLEPEDHVSGQGTAIVLGGVSREVDHVAQVVSDEIAMTRLLKQFERLGADVIEAPHIFPDDVCDVPVDNDVRKRLATVRLPDVLLVIGTSLTPGDQLDRHWATWGPSVPHHVALRVGCVEHAVEEWRDGGYLIGPITDDGELAQVFMRSPAGQIVELISRKALSDTTFSCANIAALSIAEEALRAAAPSRRAG